MHRLKKKRTEDSNRIDPPRLASDQDLTSTVNGGLNLVLARKAAGSPREEAIAVSAMYPLVRWICCMSHDAASEKPIHHL
jgi:hypothetical protein